MTRTEIAARLILMDKGTLATVEKMISEGYGGNGIKHESKATVKEINTVFAMRLRAKSAAEFTASLTSREMMRASQKAAKTLETAVNAVTVTTTLTANEAKVLAAIDASEYGEYLTDGVWLFSVRDRSGIRGKVLSGVVSNLVQKRFVTVAGGTRPLTSDSANVDKDHEIAMTDAGASAYAAHLVATHAQPRKPRG